MNFSSLDTMFCLGYYIHDTRLLSNHTHIIFPSPFLYSCRFNPTYPRCSNCLQTATPPYLSPHLQRAWQEDPHTLLTLLWWIHIHQPTSSSTWQHNLCQWGDSSMVLGYQHGEEYGRWTFQHRFVSLQYRTLWIPWQFYLPLPRSKSSHNSSKERETSLRTMLVLALVLVGIVILEFLGGLPRCSEGDLVLVETIFLAFWDTWEASHAHI